MLILINTMLTGGCIQCDGMVTRNKESGQDPPPANSGPKVGSSGWGEI